MVTIDNNYFSISQICESGQCFRLDPVSENTYELLAGGKYLKIEVRQQGSRKRRGERYYTVQRKSTKRYGKNILTFQRLMPIMPGELTKQMNI